MEIIKKGIEFVINANKETLPIKLEDYQNIIKVIEKIDLDDSTQVLINNQKDKLQEAKETINVITDKFKLGNDNEAKGLKSNLNNLTGGSKKRKISKKKLYL